MGQDMDGKKSKNVLIVLYMYTIESSTPIPLNSNSSGKSLLAAIQAQQPATSQPAISVELTEDDIPGAHLDEPYERHNVQALKWWLLCRGIKN